MTELLKNQIYDAEITGFSSDGGGVCRIEGRAVFVPRAIPGELWRVRIVKANRTAVWGRGEELLRPSPHRVEPRCPVYGRCGGCACMHMDYETELLFKRGRVDDALRRIGGLELRTEGILGAEEPEGYRNKAIYNFAPGPVRGFYRARSHNVISAPRCLLQPERFDRAADALCAWMAENGVPAYDEASGKGLVRHLFLRSGAEEGLLACIVAAGELPASPVDAMRRACPELTGILLCLNDRPGNAVLTDDIRPLWGAQTVEQKLCGARFRLSPLTFFQVNTAQAERLYALAGSYAEPGGKLVLDLYCGAGSIGQAVARDAARLVGNDVVPAAIENARRNAETNGITNAEYFCGDASAVAERLARDGLRPDVIIADPPRKGMDEAVLSAIASMAPKRLVYVSCDPGTLARDLKRLDTLGFTAVRCQAVDLFPRTQHVETVVQLSQQKASTHIKVDLDLDELGKPLFIRKKRGVELTPEGEELYARILPSMQALIACEDQFRDGSLTPGSSVAISVEPGLFEDILMPRCLPKLFEKFPQTRVRNVDMSGDEIENKLLSGELDFACAWIFRLLTNRCEVTPLIQIRNVPIVGDQYAALAERPQVSLAELAELPLILVPETYKVYVHYSRLFSANGLTMQPALTVSSVHQQIAAVKAGLGFSFVPFFSAADELGVHPLRLREDTSNAFMDFLITPKDRPLSAPAKYLCELFQAELIDAAARQEAFFRAGT